MMNEWMLQNIIKDFSMSLVHKTDTSAYLCAQRNKTWHFLNYFSDDNEIQQLHLTRFEVANAVLNDHSNKPGYCSAISDLLIEKTGIGFAGYDKTTEMMQSQIDKDVKVLNLAKNKVRQKDDIFIVDGYTTHLGNPIQSYNRLFMEAIQFEAELYDGLNPKDFGLYSAFCTYNEFILDREFPLDRVAGLVQGQLEYSPDRLLDEYLLVAMEIQESLLDDFIWGKGIRRDVNQSIEMMYDFFNNMTYLQQTQFVLSSGMHNDVLFLPLGLSNQVISEDVYLEFQTSSFQPDSLEDQKLRSDTAFITLLNKFDDEAEPYNPAVQVNWADMS